MSWRYIASRLNGDGTETFLHYNLPLSDVSLTPKLSGPAEFGATITPEVADLADSKGNPIFVPWSTALYAEADGLIRCGSILADIGEAGPKLSLDGVGFSGYAAGMPYTDTYSGTKLDPLDIVRMIWKHIQDQKSGDIGLNIDDTTSTVKIGTKKKDVNFKTSGGEDVSFEAGPYTLNWWDTDDLGGEIDSLAESTPFDYRESHKWNGDTIDHKLVLGYPTLGRRRQDLRFVVGENVLVTPTVNLSGDDYASEVMFLGAGEGRKMIRGTAKRTTDRLRRAVVISDKAKDSKKAANKAAERDLAMRVGDEDITDLTVQNHPHAKLGSWDPGDEILLQLGDYGWGRDVSLWLRVLDMKISPDKDTIAMSVTRTDRVSSQ